MEATNYTSIGPVLQLNKAGELAQKRMKAAKVCDGLYVTEPDKRDFVRYIIECNGVMWVESTQSKSYAERYAAAMPEALKKVKAGFYSGENRNNYCREIDRRINHPDSPAIMELKKPERKKAEPLAENERKVSVLIFKGCTDEMTEKKVVITEVAPHVYTYTYKLKKYGERVKVIFEIDGVYFQGSDNGAHIMEREDFTEVCTKAYEHARENVADGAAKGMAYLIEVQKRIDAATSEQVDTPAEAPQISTETAETVNVSAEGENAKNEPIKHISEVLKEAEQNYQCVKSETLHTVRETDGKWHTYFMGDEIGIDLAYDQINHIPASRTAQAAEEVAEIRRYMNRLNGILLADADYYLAEMREGIKQAEAARRKKNADTESEDAAEPRKTTLSSREQVLSYLDKLHGMEYDAGEVVYFKDGCTAEEHEDGAVWHVYPDTESDEAIQTLRIAPQMPETPQTIECTADTPKPRETARKRPNRAIGCAQRSRHSGLGAGGYSMLNNASATLAAMSVPRECYTADYR